jgi:hypothetical protein
MMGAIVHLARRFLGWLFGAPFKALPPEFGDDVPSELRVFEAEAEESRREPSEGGGTMPAPPPVRSHRPVK